MDIFPETLPQSHAREKPLRKEKVEQKPKKRGRPKKGEERPKVEKRVEKQLSMTQEERLADLPKRMVPLYDLEAIGNIPEFVLHDLCHEDCFNLKKAAFLVDNPDFDSLQGVA